MINITVLPGKMKYEYENEISVSEFLHDISYYIPHPCAGKGICMKCMVKISGELSSLSDKEYGISEPGYRLACQTKITGNAVIYLDVEHPAEMSFDYIPDGNYSIAADIGTTSVEISFVNTDTSRCYDFLPFNNPQLKFGNDVISRISAGGNQSQLGEMQSLIFMEIKSILKLFCTEKRTFSGRIYVSGNTAMQYIASLRNTSDLGVYPYSVKHDFINENIRFMDFDVKFNPVLSAFLGGDFLGGAAYVMEKFKYRNMLYMDLGTNGELFIKKNDEIMATSCAMGPALEGMNITFGTMFTRGAAYHFDSKTGSYMVEKSEKFFGITGTCLIDVISYFIENELINSNGEIVKGDEYFEAAYYSNEKCLKLNDEVCITQTDIRNFQLAKAAVGAAVEILLRKYYVYPEKPECVVLAGTLGKNLNMKNFVKTGFLPDNLCDNVIFAGNTSLESAKLSLIDEKFRKKIILLKENVKIEYLDTQTDFNEKFIDHILF
ncbi:MAG: DUF4445 domain-containing protein [Spirochaetes bacterium]|nr:DUF4445 domain-containing protein [Spirochaetota bacterium]